MAASTATSNEALTRGSTGNSDHAAEGDTRESDAGAKSQQDVAGEHGVVGIHTSTVSPAAGGNLRAGENSPETL